MNILVSIILPVFNGEQYLEECLKSIWQQSFSDFECIVIDDGSTDSTPLILASQSDKRLRIINQNVQGGICKALNLGIECAQGRYLVRMDADDICHPRRLQKQIEFLDQHPQIGFCGSWVRRFGENQVPQVYSRPVSFQKIRAYAVFDNPMIHSSVMIRSECLRSLTHGYKEDFAGAEDYELWTRLMENTECENLSEVLLEYRVHPQSITLTKTDTMDRLACRILKRELYKLGIAPSEREVLQHRLWSTGRLDKDGGGNQIERAEAWLNRLIAANRDCQLHDKNAFFWAVREIWFALCYQMQVLGYPVLHRFFQSSIGRGDIKHGCILIGSLVKRRLM